MTSKPAIEVRSLVKTFGAGRGQVAALSDVTFDVPSGSALAIVGENGSGKSTLLDTLLGLTPPTSGSVRIQGETAALLELGAGFFHELTGRENAMQLALLAGASSSEARALAERAAEFAELGDFFERPVRTYSAGMLMRLGFAIASNLKAPVVIIDEVLAVGDGYFQRKCIDRLVEMRRNQTTLVIAAHDLHALRGLCDQALWLRNGRTAALGPVDVVLSAYEDHLRKRGAVRAEAPGTGGTGEVVIRSVRLTDAHGAPRAEFRSGETLRVEVEFETREPLDSPVMGVALFRDDGVYCYGPNTLFDGQLTGRYDGRYVLVASFEGLPLLGGRYEASVAFYDKQHVYAYAWHHRLYPFTVLTERPDHGLVWLPHRFDVRRLDEAR
ncbi:MAG: Wzt carbohydrate-binding domain-containing protein [Vicinamibacteria bacterium]|nr:Wzt carbohydrate-binding domain-containing protein [Vicinamibacteria bacterium]